MPATGGTAKKATMKELTRYCNYVVNKNYSIDILEVYEVKQPKEYKANARWVNEAICEIVLEELKKYVPTEATNSDVYEVFLETYQLTTLVDLINNNYYLERSKFAKLPGKEKDQASQDFYDLTSNKLPSVVKSIVNSLRSRYLMQIDKTCVIVDKITKVKSFANSKQLQHINDMKAKLLETDEYQNYSNLASLYRTGAIHKFNKQLNVLLLGQDDEQGYTISKEGYLFYPTKYIQLRLDKLARDKAKSGLNLEMRTYLIVKLKKALATYCSAGSYNMTRDEQKAGYEITFTNHINESIDKYSPELLEELATIYYS
jgi:hypothetical protein